MMYYWLPQYQYNCTAHSYESRKSRYDIPGYCTCMYRYVRVSTLHKAHIYGYGTVIADYY